MCIKKYIKDFDYYKKIIFIGMIINILWVIFINTQPMSDFKYYNELATSISKGGNFGNTYTSVGYPIILGQIYKVFGAHIFVAKVFNLILTAITYCVFLSIINKINLNSKAKKLIFTLFVFFPCNIFYNSLLANEILFTTILLIITNLYFAKISIKKYFIIGILTGIATMIKPFFIAFPLAIFLVEIITSKKIVCSLKNSFIIGIVACIVISPWIYRNTKLMGQFTGISNNGGIVLYINNNSQNKYGKWMAAEKVENSIVLKEKYKMANLTQRNKMLSDAAKDWIIKHPIQFVILGVKRVVGTYSVGEDILYSLHGTEIGKHGKFIFEASASELDFYLIGFVFIFIITNAVKVAIFIPAIIFIYSLSIKIFMKIIKRKMNSINKFDLYLLIIFHMFTSVYFITEGQGRYAFPVIFLLVYFFAKWYFKLKKKTVTQIGSN